MFLTLALSSNVRLCILRWSTSRYNSNVIFHIETQKNFTMALLRDANGFEHNHRAQLFVYFHLQFTAGSQLHVDTSGFCQGSFASLIHSETRDRTSYVLAFSALQNLPVEASARMKIKKHLVYLCEV